jgi:hypothetical protein
MRDSVLSASLVLMILALFGALIQTHLELAQLKQRLRRYDALSSREDFEQQLDSNIHLKQGEISNLEEQQQTLEAKVNQLQRQLRTAEAKAYLQTLDSYEPYYSFLYSEDYVIQLKNIKAEQETLKAQGRAYISHSEWIVGESKKEGKKMIKNLLELIKLAFENQCKYVIQEAKYNNISSLEKKIVGTFDRINKWSAVTHCEISQDYLDLRLRELHLKCELEEKKQEEKEKKQEIDRQRRQEARVIREAEKAEREVKEAEEREILHQQELERIRHEVERTEGAAKKQLEEQVQKLLQQINQDQRDREDAALRYAKVKEGHIYVISNFGSFGKDNNIYRIFMTKSGSEDEYVRSMNPMVPFPFDVHFKIYSEDVLNTIKRLHQRFYEKRVNLYNERRDFFRVELDEIEQAVEEIRREGSGVRVLESMKQPQSLEYIKTLSLERKKQQN